MCRIYETLNDLTEAVVQRCSVKKVFLGIPQNSQENTCARASFLNILLQNLHQETDDNSTWLNFRNWESWAYFL